MDPGLSDDKSRLAEFGGRLRALLAERNWSQGDLARAMETEQSTVSGWCRGQTQPRLFNLIDLAETLGVSLDALCRGIEAPTGAASLPEMDQMVLEGFHALNRTGKLRVLSFIQDEMDEEAGGRGRHGAP